MDVSARSYLTAGVAALGVGALALSPLQPLDRGAGLPSALTSSQAVQLTAIDVITPWLQVFNDTETNVANLLNSFLGPNDSNAGDGKTVGAPVASLQQAAANWLEFGTELPDVFKIWNQFVNNSAAALKAPFAPDTTTLNDDHALVYGLLPVLAPDVPQGLVDIMTTSLTGIAAGVIGPALGPLLALRQSVTDIIASLKTLKWSDALNTALNIPAVMTGAFLNGGPVLDLTWVAPLLGFPASVTKFGLAMGGVLSPGGSLLNAVDTAVQLDPDTTVTIAGVPAGAIGSVMGLDWAVASSIGWKRNGNPLKPGIPVPTLASQRVAASASAVAAPDSATTDAPADDAPTPKVTAPRSGGDSGAPASSRKAGRSASTGSHAGKSASKRAAKGAARSAASRAG